MTKSRIPNGIGDSDNVKQVSQWLGWVKFAVARRATPIRRREARLLGWYV